MHLAYRLQIITPQGVVYAEDVTHALVPAEDGFVGVLAYHAPYVTSSPGGRLEVEVSKDPAQVKKKKFAVGSGFFSVSKNQALFLTQSFAQEEALHS